MKIDEKETRSQVRFKDVLEGEVFRELGDLTVMLKLNDNQNTGYNAVDMDMGDLYRVGDDVMCEAPNEAVIHVEW